MATRPLPCNSRMKTGKVFLVHCGLLVHFAFPKRAWKIRTRLLQDPPLYHCSRSAYLESRTRSRQPFHLTGLRWDRGCVHLQRTLQLRGVLSLEARENTGQDGRERRVFRTLLRFILHTARNLLLVGVLVPLKSFLDKQCECGTN